MNPANFKSWIDPEGGEWIRMTMEAWKDVVWRPTDLYMSDNDNLSFQLEMFTGPGIRTLTAEEYQQFGKVAGNILTDMLAAEAAELQEIAEATKDQPTVVETLTEEAKSAERPRSILDADPNEIIGAETPEIILPGQF